jgi:hypothetical protein
MIVFIIAIISLIISVAALAFSVWWFFVCERRRKIEMLEMIIEKTKYF